MYLSKMELTKPHTPVVLIDVCVNTRSHIRAKWALKRENMQETAGMVSRREGDTKNYNQTWGQQKTYLVKNLLTVEVMTAMGMKAAAVVSTGARRRGRERWGGFFLLNDMSSKRIRMTVHGPRRPNTTENRVINEGQNPRR
jgi:hypothetical protein